MEIFQTSLAILLFLFDQKAMGEKRNLKIIKQQAPKAEIDSNLIAKNYYYSEELTWKAWKEKISCH